MRRRYLSSRGAAPTDPHTYTHATAPLTRTPALRIIIDISRKRAPIQSYNASRVTVISSLPRRRDLLALTPPTCRRSARSLTRRIACKQRKTQRSAAMYTHDSAHPPAPPFTVSAACASGSHISIFKAAAPLLAGETPPHAVNACGVRRRAADVPRALLLTQKRGGGGLRPLPPPPRQGYAWLLQHTAKADSTWAAAVCSFSATVHSVSSKLIEWGAFDGGRGRAYCAPPSSWPIPSSPSSSSSS